MDVLAQATNAYKLCVAVLEKKKEKNTPWAHRNTSKYEDKDCKEQCITSFQKKKRNKKEKKPRNMTNEGYRPPFQDDAKFASMVIFGGNNV